MNSPNNTFDIMIIYDAHLACSALDSNYHESSPFALKSEYFNCNDSYRYFLEYCTKQGMTAALTTTKDINAKGEFKSAWIYKNKWKRFKSTAKAKIVFDKFSNLLARNTKAYKLLTNTRKSQTLFHNQATRILFDNKFKTYLKFPNFTIPSVEINSLTKINIKNAKKSLHARCDKHLFHDDFNSKLVLKDKFGLGGNNIFQINNDHDFSAAPHNASMQFILQPLIEASGFTIAKCTRSSDLRVIMCNNIIIQSYLRIAKIGEFRANAQQGGKIIYLTLKQIPKEVLLMINKIKKLLPNPNALCTLDFIKSKSGNLYFIEGNNSPGLNWFDLEDEKRAKQLIRLVVKKLKMLVLAI